MPDHNRPWPVKNVERPLPPRSAWPADRPTSGLCYSPRHVHVCPYVHDCLHRQAIWTVSRPASRPCPLRNARILNVPPHSHCALSRQAVSLHELSLQPAFINIIVVGTNMVSSSPFASRRHSPGWANASPPTDEASRCRMRARRRMAIGRDSVMEAGDPCLARHRRLQAIQILHTGLQILQERFGHIMAESVAHHDALHGHRIFL